MRTRRVIKDDRCEIGEFAYLTYRYLGVVLRMARRATSLKQSKKIQARMEPTDTAEQAPVERPRRGRKAKMEGVPAESASGIGMIEDGDTGVRTDVVLGGSDQPAKARRGRKPKSQVDLEPPATGNERVTSSKPTTQARNKPKSQPGDARSTIGADTQPEAMPPKARRGRKPKAQPASELASVHERQSQQASASSAAHWDPVSGGVTFDWAAIERVAMEGGANQAMAKLLLAARAEGTSSRWPF